MSMKVSGPVDQGFGLGKTDFAPPQGRLNDQQQAGGGIDFGRSPGAGAQSVNFGSQSPQTSDSQVAATAGATNPAAQDLAAVIRNLVEQIMQALAQFMQQNRNDTGASSQNSSGSPQGKSAAVSEPGQPMAANAEPQQTAGASGVAEPSSADPQIASSSVPASTPLADTPTAPQAAAAAQPAGSTNAVGDTPAAGSGPYSVNITNTQDHPIKIGQFDKNEKLVAELSLEPGQKGTMKYEADTEGLLKQADADGNYKADASRFEFYNGFVNTSDIDGRNAAIHATDGKGFEIGDKQSIADKAPDSITSLDSAGNKTIAGWYDGSTEKMKQGGDFLTKELGTGMTYQHPNDDTLGQGNNPMRHTDSMSLDATFGKA